MHRHSVALLGLASLGYLLWRTDTTGGATATPGVEVVGSTLGDLREFLDQITFTHTAPQVFPGRQPGTDPGTEVAHSQKEARDQPTHKVTVTPGSRLARVMGADEVEVNSFHHQVIKSLGRGLTAVAWAPDHLIEGVELEDDTRWVLGVQWHPEHLTKDSEPARRLFAALVTAART